MSTVTLLQCKSSFWRYQGQLYEGTATGGAASKITDTALKNVVNDIWPDSFPGKQLRITSGSASGDLRLCTQEDRTQGDLFPQADFSAAIANTNTYEVWGNSVHGGTALTNLFNDVLRTLRPVTQTQLTIVSDKRLYSITSSVDALEDIVRVWKRRLNYEVGGDYIPEIVWGWHPIRLDGATTPTLTIQIPAVSPSANTQLNGSIDASVTTITVDSTAAGTNDSPPAFPGSGRIVIDSELIDYTGTTATTFTGCTRGAGQSTAASHNNDAKVNAAGGATYWLEHRASFTAFSSDTSTLDALYRDWVVWETLMRFARQKVLVSPATDQKRWKALLDQAAPEAMAWRHRFNPGEPILIHPMREV